MAKIDYINIDSDSNYFNTQEQVRLRNVTWFIDRTAPTKLSGSNVVVGLFSHRSVAKDDAVYNSTSYATSSTVTDPSGAGRRILSLSNDYLASGTLDSYKNGVEITQEKHWTAGLAKITAGTPGHLYDASTLYGVPSISVVASDAFFELNYFDPVKFVETGGDPDLFTYPVITSDRNQLENFVLDGIIEPFPIRSVVSNFSVNFPFEPHSTWGDYGNGNVHRVYGSDEVLTVDYYEPGRVDLAPFLDAVDLISMQEASSSVFMGATQGYLTTDRKRLAPFEDVSWPWDPTPPSSYTSDLVAAIEAMPSGSLRGGTTYVGKGQRAATSGFVYDDATMGTDSIAYGGKLY